MLASSKIKLIVPFEQFPKISSSTVFKYQKGGQTGGNWEAEAVIQVLSEDSNYVTF
jgi:hypothetical protein